MSADVVLACRPLVTRIARQVSRRVKVRQRALIDDLVSEGMLALLTASFDPTRGVPWEVYAAQKVRWAMRDYLRSECEAHGYNRSQQAWIAHQTSLEDAQHVPVSAPSPEQACIASHIRRAVRRAAPAASRTVVTLLLANWEQQAIAQRIGKSESRVSQLRIQAIAAIRLQMAA